MKISYRYFQNPQQQALAERLLLNLPIRFPKWIEELTVDLYQQHQDGSDITASANVSLAHYRCAGLDLFYQFFDQSEEEMVNSLIHEVIHFHQAELLNFIREDLLPLVTNTQLQEYLTRRSTNLIESTTQDLTYAIHKPKYLPFGFTKTPSEMLRT